jgi:hypothetical protein
MLDTFKDLDTDKQVAFLLGLSEMIANVLSTSPNYKDVTHALNVCWNWLETKQISGDDIYSLLDDGTEINGLFMQMQDETDDEKELVWGCIVDAVSFTNWRAYQFEGEEYLPAPIENVDEDLAQQFLDGFYQLNETNESFAEGFISVLNEMEIGKKEDIINLITNALA